MASTAQGRFVARHQMTARDFEELASRLSVAVLRARKIGYVAARQARVAETVETRWNGSETVNTAAAGDWIVTSLSPGQQPLVDRDGNLNVYVIPAARFCELYEPTCTVVAEGAVYRSKSEVLAIRMPAGFDIMAPWGERQVGEQGYLILNGGEVYGNNADTFEATYELVPR
jgi:hypothetical protein